MTAPGLPEPLGRLPAVRLRPRAGRCAEVRRRRQPCPAPQRHPPRTQEQGGGLGQQRRGLRVPLSAPADYAQHHTLRFTFPYSHGLLASGLWAALVGGLTWLVTPQGGSPRRRAAFVIGAAVCSHWLLDALVHIPELPLTGAHSPHVGLALWDHMPLALTLETGITAAGLALYLRGSRRSRRRTTGVIVL